MASTAAAANSFLLKPSKPVEIGKASRIADTSFCKNASKRCLKMKSCSISATAGQQDNMAMDSDVTLIKDEYNTGAAMSWLDTNYLFLKLQSHKIVENEAKNALNKHFTKKNDTKTEKIQACAFSPSHIFICGDVKFVASTICPASIAVSGNFIGTSHMA